jgi:hypothetical protein
MNLLVVVVVASAGRTLDAAAALDLRGHGRHPHRSR